jgi:hypothetical protein
MTIPTNRPADLGALCAAVIPDDVPDPVLTGALCGEDAMPDSRFCRIHQHTDHCGD